MVSEGNAFLSRSKTLRRLRPNMIAAAEPATRAPTMMASKSWCEDMGANHIEMTRHDAQGERHIRKEPPLSRGLSRFARPRGLGLIQQQFRHLASLRNGHSGGKLGKVTSFWFSWAPLSFS